MLQWGRTLSSAEVGDAADNATQAGEASMGPHSFKCGSPADLPATERRGLRFNGAALFQVRKFSPSILLLAQDLSLQWGRTLSSAEVLGSRTTLRQVAMLQWGRTLSSAEVARGMTS